MAGSRAEQTVQKKTEYDVIVVGAGIAGLSAALSVAEAGFTVVVLEKEAEPGGTTMLSDGAFNAIDARRQIRLRVEDSPEKHWMQAWDVSKQKGREELLKTLAYEAPATLRWLEVLGLEFEDNVTQLPGSRFPRTHLPKAGKGDAYIRVLLEAAEKLRVPVLCQSPVVGLKKDRFGRVNAVEVHRVLATEGNGEPERSVFNARLGVVLASGGFAQNQDLLHLHGPGYRKATVLSAPGCTGEVMLAAADIGAGLIGMPFFALGFKTTAYCLPIDPSKFILVNNDAKRFIREDVTEQTLLDAVMRQKGSEAWLVCHDDEQNDESVPEDFRQKLIDEAKVYSTRSLVNEPDPLGKPSALIKPIGKPYCLSRLYPTILTSLGGLEIDTDARVISRKGKPIRGLVAAGDVTGGIHGERSLLGDNLASAASFGRIAARTLLRES